MTKRTNVEKMLDPFYEYSQKDVAEKMFLSSATVIKIERQAIDNFKKALAHRGITIEDLLG